MIFQLETYTTAYPNSLYISSLSIETIDYTDNGYNCEGVCLTFENLIMNSEDSLDISFELRDSEWERIHEFMKQLEASKVDTPFFEADVDDSSVGSIIFKREDYYRWQDFTMTFTHCKFGGRIEIPLRGALLSAFKGEFDLSQTETANWRVNL